MRLRGQECRRVPATDALSYSVCRTSSTLTWSNPRRRQIGGLSQRLDRCEHLSAALGTLPVHAELAEMLGPQHLAEDAA